MNDEIRLQFDVACALGLLVPGEQLPVPFPRKLDVEERAKAILADCVKPGSYSRTSCRIRTDFSKSHRYYLTIGNDQLTLASGGYIFVGGSGVTVQLHDSLLDRHFALN